MPTTTPHPSADDLAAFDAGALPAGASEAVERHVSECGACCQLLEALPENALAARLREFARGSTATGGDTGQRAASSSNPAAEVPVELAAHPRFEILALVGTGAMGAVYRARQRHLDRLVAVKVLHRRLTDRPGFAERFHRETQALARLNHPNIVQAHDADRAGESHFLVMEFVTGEGLDALVRRRGPLPAAEACELARQVAVGLQHAHERHLVHRDIKPGNLLLTEQGVVKIADFGLARLAGADEPAEPGSVPVVLGTPAFMAPEQARDAARADVRSDLYSLGCTLYFLLTGKPPFTGTSHLQTLLDHQDAPVPAMLGVPREVEAVVHRLLAKDPTARFATPAEAAVALSLSAGARSAPATPHRWRLAALATCGLAGSIALAVSLSGPGSRPAEPKGPGAGEQAAGPEVAPLPRVVDRDRLATPEELAALRRSRADELIEWVRTNNKWKPDAEIARANATRVEKAFAKADAYVLTFGGGLMRSGRPTLVAAQAGGVFAWELTPEQAQGASLGPMSHVFGSHSFAAGPRRRVPRVELSNFRLDTAASHPIGARIEGEITCDFANPPEPGDHLRLTHYYSSGRRVSFLYHPKPLPAAGRVTLRFSANPIEPGRPQDERLVPIFAEWVSRGATGDVIESNTKAALLLLQADR